MQQVGVYTVKRKIAEGGMGEIFLAYDPVCHREVALKTIKPSLRKHESIQKRFVREARVAASLTHPSIMPIYELDPESLYYTMPYIEGETLKEILKAGDCHPVATSVQQLVSLFLKVCEAMAYAHSKGILHRDLKPDNIIVGQFGEVLILDWGIAQCMSERDEAEVDLPDIPDLTRPGKIVGTTNYMAPERASGGEASQLTEIYALGVMLYQILTLSLPFKRGPLKEFQKTAGSEIYIEPHEVAPYRDIPVLLASLAKACLDPEPKNRPHSVEAVIRSVRDYADGTPEWVEAAQLSVTRGEDWEFQENVILAKHMALTRHPEVMEWVSLMLSKQGYAGNMQLECDVTLDADSDGIGFLLSVPEASERKGLEEGYCLWLDSSGHTILYRNNVEVARQEGAPICSGKVTIERVEGTLRLYIDGTFRMSFSNFLPLVGTHIGLIARDAHYTLSPITVRVGGQRVMVNCLSIPDALMASKNFSHALTEYRRIADSFEGRPEGREARFRAGYTLIERAKWEGSRGYIGEAFEEFERLANSPLEYLGKSLIYAFEGDAIEEAKCFEFALRKYATHPLKHLLEQHLTLRLHEATQKERLAGYQLGLVALIHTPSLVRSDLRALLISPLDTPPFLTTKETKKLVAFFLGKPYALLSAKEERDVQSIFYAMGHETTPPPFARHYLDVLTSLLPKRTHLTTDSTCATSDTEREALLTLEVWRSLLMGDPALDMQSDLERVPHFLSLCSRIVQGLPHTDALTEVPTIGFPKSEFFLAAFLSGKLGDAPLLWWEELTLQRQLALYYHCLGRRRKCAHASKRAEELEQSQKIALPLY